MNYVMNKNSEYQVIKNSTGLILNFREDGRLFSIRKNQFILNQLETEFYEKTLKKIFVRIYENNSIKNIVSILDIFENKIEVIKTADKIIYKLANENFASEVSMFLASFENIVFNEIKIKNLKNSNLTFDIIYGQDLGISDFGCIKANEAYTCQYIDHKIFNSEKYGFITCSRQNMNQGAFNPFMQIGSFDKIKSYSTDGFQFFETKYRVTADIAKLKSSELDNKNYQYEFAYIVLQTEKKILGANEESKTVFYNYFVENIPESNVTENFAVDKFEELYKAVKLSSDKAEPLTFDSNEFAISSAKFFDSKYSNKDVLNTFYPKRKYEEKENGKLISFFTEEGSYVSLKEKEEKIERPTGQIIISGNFLEGTDNLISSTSFGMGIFNSQITVGNTSFNKLIGINRNPLNLQRFSGQRIFIKEGNRFVQLGTPTFYEVGYNYAKWIYLNGEDKIEVQTFTSSNSAELSLEIASTKNHDFVITNHLIFGNNENDSKIIIEQNGKLIKVTGENDLIISTYKDTNFAFSIKNEFEIINTRGNNMVLSFANEKNIKLNIAGALYNDSCVIASKTIEFETEKKSAREIFGKLIKNFKVNSDNFNIEKISEMSMWYAHNAMIHFASPHGLEQYSGAAWGTRDISQGPMEFFLSTQNYKMVAKILKELFRHQHEETGVWPQWFMFDKYYRIQQEESHGDVLVWPIKAISSYIKASGDINFLEEKVAYTSIEKHFEFTEEKFKIIDHVKKIYEYIKNNLSNNTNLLAYGDGDWDDTLQPKDAALRKKMVSCWTVELLIQSTGEFVSVLEKYNVYPEYAAELKKFRELMIEDFNKYAIQDGVVGGFLLHDGGKFLPLLHPDDDITKIKYRLLPMTRGIISEIFSKEAAMKHYEIIEKILLFPDGVRLMAEPITYQAGKQSYFKRAEQAANVGREIGLQYCHAHVRFIESLCKLGKGKEAIENILRLIPININDSVKNADLRQSNSFFSSSDAAFLDRYEFKKSFNKLKTGEVKVKGGWRVYSSGPGIIMNQVISNIFGIREEGEILVLDPVLAKADKKYSLEYNLLGANILIKYFVENSEHTPKKLVLNGKEIAIENLTENRYRTGGAKVSKSVIKNNLVAGQNILEIYL